MSELIWHTEKRKIKDLIPTEGNPRQMTKKQAMDLQASLEKFNLVDIPAINIDNRIISGHQRVSILKILKQNNETIDVRVPNRKLTESEHKEYLIRANKNIGEWDLDVLCHFDEDLLKDIGFESTELDKIFQLDDKPEDDDAPPIPKKPKSKVGDIYQLGNHLVMCGNSTKKEDVEKLMDGKKADMIFTDPPYGMKLDTDFSSMKGILGVGNKYKKVIGDNCNYNPNHIFRDLGYCKEVFLWGADYYAEVIPKRNEGCFFVWDKTESGVNPNSAYEKCFGSNFELCWSRAKHKRQIVPVLWKGIFGLSKEDIKKRIHPTQKPVRLYEWFINKFSKRGKMILDLFLGSGSTLIACEKTERICYGMEIDPQYTDVIVQRYIDYTGNENIIKNGKKIKWQK